MAKKVEVLFGTNVQRKRADLPFTYRFNVRGQQYTGETHERDLKKAEAFAKARKDEVLGQSKQHVMLGLNAGITFGQAADAWWNEQGRRNKDPGLESQVIWMKDKLGEDTLLSDIRPAHVIELRELRRDTERKCAVNGVRKVTDSTVNYTLANLRAILNYAHLVHRAPVGPIPWKKIRIEEGEIDIRVLTVDELRAIISVLRPDLHDALQFALASAKRINEVLTLTWRQVDFNVAHPTMTLKTKGQGQRRKTMIDPLGPTELDILRRQLQHQIDATGAQPHPDARVFTFVAQQTRTYKTKTGEVSYVAGQRYPLLYTLFQQAMDNATDELGLGDVTIHVLRHTAATWMLRAGVPIEAVSRALNHSSIAITLKYYAKVTATEVAAGKLALSQRVAAELQRAPAPHLKLIVSQG
jgi:integrase